MRKRRKTRRKNAPIYVVGRKEDGFCWLLSTEAGRRTDDQDIGVAERFHSLEGAARAARAVQASVFEVIDERAWPAVLEEVL